MYLYPTQYCPLSFPLLVLHVFFLSVLIVVYTIGELFHKLWCKQKSLIIKIGIHIKISCVTVKLFGVLLYVTLEQVFFSVFLFTVMSLYDFCHHHRYP